MAGGLIVDGKRDTDKHVDRIDASRGYEDGNIQILSGYENVAKGNRERHCPRYQHYLKARKIIDSLPPVVEDDEDWLG